MKVMRLPVVRVPVSTSLPPVHQINMVLTYVTKLMAGKNMRLSFVESRFASNT